MIIRINYTKKISENNDQNICMLEGSKRKVGAGKRNFQEQFSNKKPKPNIILKRPINSSAQLHEIKKKKQSNIKTQLFSFVSQKPVCIGVTLNPTRQKTPPDLVVGRQNQ
jgi:hypothetical protein